MGIRPYIPGFGVKPVFKNPFDDESLFGRNRFDPLTIQPEEFPRTSLPKSSFIDDYDRVSGHRPERDRLRALIDSAPKREDFRPNKLEGIGAVLSGISTGWKDPSKGSEVARSIIDRPYTQAIDEYEKRLRNVSALAGMEGEDIDRKIKGLDVAENIRRNDREYALNRDRFGLDQSELDLRKSEAEENDWVLEKNEDEGTATWVNKKGLGTRGTHKIGLPAIEKANKALEDYRKKAEIDFGYDKTLEGIRAGNKKVDPVSQTEILREINNAMLDFTTRGIKIDDYIERDDSGNILGMKPAVNGEKEHVTNIRNNIATVITGIINKGRANYTPKGDFDEQNFSIQEIGPNRGKDIFLPAGPTNKNRKR